MNAGNAGLRSALISNNENWIIIINKNIEFQERHNFTSAHELGHYFCHREISTNFQCSREKIDNKTEDSMEREANKFASEILMPANIIREKFFNKFSIRELLEMRSLFASSIISSALRRMQLSPEPCVFVVSRDGIVDWSWCSPSAKYSKLRPKRFTNVPRNALISHNTQSHDPVLRSGAWGEDHYHESSFISDKTGFCYTCLQEA